MKKIEIITDEHKEGTRQARFDFAEVTGKTIELKPAIFREKQTGHEFCHIVGALAYPGIEPGCVMIFGIQAGPLKFRLLEYREHTSVFDLITDVVTTRNYYGYGHHSAILQQWIGDPERYLSIVVKISTAIEQKSGHDKGLYIREPADWAEKHAFAMYIRQLYSALSDKLLILQPHTQLINRLQAFQPDSADKGNLADYPAVGMLGGLVHSLMIERPWEQDIDHGGPIILQS